MDAATNCLKASLSACLMSMPVWADLLHFVSDAAQFIGVTSGAAIGVVTLYRMLRRKDR